MGLFGGYKQKDYDNNTALFHKYIEAIGNRCDIKFVNAAKEIAPDTNVRSLLLQIDMMLDRLDIVGKVNWKQLESIDANILTFIQKLQADVQSNKPAMFIMHLNLLASVAESRIVCNELRDAATLRAEVIVNETSALLSDVLREKVVIVKAMNELEEEGSKLSDDDPALDTLEKKYMEYESRMRVLEAKITEYRNTYQENLSIMELSGMEGMYEELPEDLDTPQGIDKRIAALNRKTEMRAQRHESIKSSMAEMAKPTDMTGGSSFKSKVDVRKQANLEKGIDAADGVGAAGETKSAFRAKIGK